MMSVWRHMMIVGFFLSYWLFQLGAKINRNSINNVSSKALVEFLGVFQYIKKILLFSWPTIKVSKELFTSRFILYVILPKVYKMYTYVVYPPHALQIQPILQGSNINSKKASSVDCAQSLALLYSHVPCHYLILMIPQKVKYQLFESKSNFKDLICLLFGQILVVHTLVKDWQKDIQL